MKKVLKIFAVVLAALASVFGMTACEMSAPDESDELMQTMCEMIDAIAADDAECARALFSEEAALASFDENFSAWKGLLAGLLAYEPEQAGWKKTIENGVSSFELTIRLKVGDKSILATAQAVEGELMSFDLAEEDAKVEGGSAFVGNIVLYVVTGLSVALVVLMVLDCARRTLNARALWIILIILGNLKFAFAGGASGFSVNFSGLSFVPFSNFNLYESGAFEIALVLPVGAIVYFCLRKTMTKIYEAPQPPAQKAETDKNDRTDD